MTGWWSPEVTLPVRRLSQNDYTSDDTISDQHLRRDNRPHQLTNRNSRQMTGLKTELFYRTGHTPLRSTWRRTILGILLTFQTIDQWDWHSRPTTNEIWRGILNGHIKGLVPSIRPVQSSKGTSWSAHWSHLPGSDPIHRTMEEWSGKGSLF